MKINNLVNNSKMLEGALKGLTVVDFTHVLAGPIITSLFVDMGANIIKLERTDGDTIRRFNPFKGTQSGYYAQLNRGKRSLCVDLKNEKSKEVIKRLVEQADIVVENFAPGSMDRLGYGYEVLSEWNPRIVMCSVSVNGQYGPECKTLGFDILSQSRGGLMAVTGMPDGPPLKTGTAIGDQVAGLHAAIGILAALYEVGKSGKGQHLDVAMADAMLRVNEWTVPYYSMFNKNPPRSGNAHPSAGPYSVYKTKDSWIIIAGVSDLIWDRFLEASGKYEWNDNPMINTIAARGENNQELQTIIDEWLSQYTTEEAIELFEKHRIPYGQVFTYEDIFTNEQFKAREMLVTLDQPELGEVTVAGNVFKFSRTPGKIQGRSALLGENNEDVLEEFGFSDTEVETLYENNIIAKPLI